MENIEKEYRALTEKNILTKEYLRRALLLLKKSTEMFDIEIDESDEFEQKINNFIGEVKRKRIV